MWLKYTGKIATFDDLPKKSRLTDKKVVPHTGSSARDGWSFCFLALLWHSRAPQQHEKLSHWLFTASPRTPRRMLVRDKLVARNICVLSSIIWFGLLLCFVFWGHNVSSGKIPRRTCVSFARTGTIRMVGSACRSFYRTVTIYCHHHGCGRRDHVLSTKHAKYDSTHFLAASCFFFGTSQKATNVPAIAPRSRPSCSFIAIAVSDSGFCSRRVSAA